MPKLDRDYLWRFRTTTALVFLMLTSVLLANSESQGSESDVSTSFKTEIDSNGNSVEQSIKDDAKSEKRTENIVKNVEEPLKEPEKEIVKSEKIVKEESEPKKTIDLGMFKKKDIDEDTLKPGILFFIFII